jgi:hypothetical protein
VIIVVILVVNLNSNTTHTPGNDQTQFVDKRGSVETSVSVHHADKTHDVILTSHRVWVHDTAYATVYHQDTIPALDSMATEAEDKNGDNKIVMVQRAYQLFITVK